MAEIKATFTANVDQMVASAKTAEQALTALEAKGLKVQGALKEMGGASDKATPQVHNLRNSLSAFDGVLASMGVNIGAETRALGELGEASGKTFTQLGLVATAGLVVGAAMAGIKLGRLISEFFELDKKMDAFVTRGAIIGAQQDVISRAIERGAAATITYSEALAFNNTWLEKHRATLLANKKANEDIATAMIELNSVGVGWQGTLNTITGATVEAIKYYLAAGVSQSVLATAYGLTAVQVKSVASALTDEVRVLADEAALMKIVEAGAKSLAEFRQSAHLQQVEILKKQAADQVALAQVTNNAVMEELAATVQLNAAHGLDAQGRIQVSSAADTLRRALEELHKTKAVGIAQTNQEIALTQTYTQTLYAEALAQDAVNFAAAAAIDTSVMHSGQRGPGVNQGGSVPFSGVSTGAGANYFAQAPHPLRGRGGPGVAGSSYIVGDTGPELYTPGASGFFTPGGGGGMNVTIYVNGTAEDVARKIAAEIQRTVMAGTKVR